MNLLTALHRGGWLRTVDVALGELLQRRRTQTPDAVALAAALASRAVAAGHSLLPLSDAAIMLAELVPERAVPALPALDDWSAALRGSPWVTTDATKHSDAVLVFDGANVQLLRYRRYEESLAARLRQLADTLSEPIDDIALARLNALFPAPAFGAADAQAKAARAALSHRLLLLTGGPGTGKTTTIARLLVLLVERALRECGQAPRIALAAPTGKAATRALDALRVSAERIANESGIDAAVRMALPSEAYTLHRLLGAISHSTRFRHDLERPLSADIIVVDEASMIDLPLMAKLVAAVRPEARLILIGDPNQLPSVEAGNVLSALCTAAEPGGALAGRRVHLDRAWRQDEALELAPLAQNVREGHADTVVSRLRAGVRGVRWRSGEDRALAAALLPEAIAAFATIAETDSPEQALAAAERFRILTAVREGPAGSAALNAAIAAALVPRGTRADAPFHGRVLMITANSYRHGLFNGDVGVIWRDDEATLRVWFRTEIGLRAWSPAALPAHQDAYALTVHKAQGSEFDAAWLVLPERGARTASRELVYTGLTRARRSLTLWASETALRAALAHSAQRWSGLAARLAESAH